MHSCHVPWSMTCCHRSHFILQTRGLLHSMALNGIEAATSHKYCCSMRAAKKKALQLEQAPSLGVQKLYKNEICSCTDVLLPPEPAWPQVTMQLSGIIAFTHRPFDTGDAFPQRSLSTEHLLHTDPLPHTHTSFYTKKLSHTEAFTQRSHYTEKLLPTSLSTKVFTQRSFYTQKLLHRETFTQRSFYTEKLLHTARFYTQKLLHKDISTQSSFSILHKEPLLQNTFSDVSKSQPFLSFGRLTFFSSERVASEISKSQFLTLDIDFVRKVDERSTPSPRKFACHQHLVRPACAVPENSHFTLRSTDAHLRSGLPVSKTNLHFTTRSFVGRARSPQKATFRWTRPGCPCRLEREFRRTWEVGAS